MHHAPPGPHPPLSPYDTTKEEEKNEQDLTRYRRSERKERYERRKGSASSSSSSSVFVVLLLFVRESIRDTHRVSTDGDQTLETRPRTPPLLHIFVLRRSRSIERPIDLIKARDRNRAEKSTILDGSILDGRNFGRGVMIAF